ncbi:MAG: hypothetical protein GY803_21985 [Chloroflexi bacterium]|nr:hypothetical protein [Chloroflexota bacterium]
MTKKTDNSNLPAKLALRRYFMDKYHSDDRARVFDACQGDGVIWRTLRQEYEVTNYWGVDEKPKKGRIKIDSVRVLGQPGWPEDVIDIDTYGSPWKHWLAMLPHVERPLTAFLTVGSGGPGRVRLGREELLAMGITIDSVLGMSGAITHNLIELAMRYALAAAYDYGLRIVEAQETMTSDSKWRTRYIGVRLEPVDG